MLNIRALGSIALSFLAPVAGAASLYSDISLGWENTSGQGNYNLELISQFGTFGTLNATNGGIFGSVSAEAVYGIQRAELSAHGVNMGFDNFRASALATSMDEIIIGGGSGLGYYTRTFTVTGSVTGSLVAFNVVRSRLIIDNGGAFFNLTGPGEFTYTAAFYFDEITYMSAAIDLAVSAPRNTGGDLDLDFGNTIVMTGLQVTDAIGRPIPGAFSITSASGTLYPIDPVPLPGTLALALGGLPMLFHRVRRRRLTF
jgi:hypothetical protein